MFKPVNLAVQRLTDLFCICLYNRSCRHHCCCWHIPCIAFYICTSRAHQKSPHLTFTENGLTVKDRDFYNWENIEGFAFSIEEVGRDNAGSIYKNYITLSLKDGTSAKIPVSNLDRKADEILYLLNEHKWESDDAEMHSKQ
ncbi:hypothetical protein ASU31_25195 [Pedobacter ginsenosidimutans]|uniref:Uncharacterized protein n=1 Tax=Pedobacter ginsenosidimutans TaxID=687842 RepID=A0A0T5VHF5_9SPHI|nr:hypothetical protein ASU31_25195 [Pedobacter ginsenosidimutans]